VEAPLDPKLAVAALLVHLIDIDGETTPQERQVVSSILQEHFELDTNQVEKLITLAHQKDSEAVDFYQFTSIITQMEMEQRIEIIAMMWQVVFSDGKNHEMEDNMVWRVAELIGVSARERTQLRKTFAAQN
ncbi:MAG: TerB family tellurite resistance protein, partial [Devosiaceae bacterium]|nr:TerB family tellurite resistance protein [Devosiaceae bacterium]